jgi:hypothetical protein
MSPACFLGEFSAEQEQPAFLGGLPTPDAMLFVSLQRYGEAGPLNGASGADLFGACLPPAF